MTTVDTHVGGPFYVWYVSVYGYGPPATVDSDASRYLAWQEGVPKALAALIPYGSMGPPGLYTAGGGLLTTPTPTAPPPPAPPPSIGAAGGGILTPTAPGPPLVVVLEEGGQPPVIAGSSDAGTFVSTAYGPPWGGIQGTGVTATGIDLRDSPHKYIIAVDPNIIPLHTHVQCSPNPYGDDSIVFAAEDTGGAIIGRHIDFYDWKGRADQLAWGRRNVTVHTVKLGTSTPPPAPTVQADTYYNPLAHASVTAERVDQGCDYAGTGYLVAIADGVITESVANGSGWEGEGYIEYRITQAGPFLGAYVYYAEGVDTVVSVGELVKGGSRLCNLRVPMPDGIEIGWAAGSGQESYYAYHDGPYHEGDATRPGLAFSNLIKALGGPPAIIEGEVVGNFPEYMPGGVVPAGVGSGSGGQSPLSGGPASIPATTAAADFTFPQDYYSAFVQVQRGADNGSHHSHSAQQYALGVTYVPMAS